MAQWGRAPSAAVTGDVEGTAAPAAPPAAVAEEELPAAGKVAAAGPEAGDAEDSGKADDAAAEVPSQAAPAAEKEEKRSTLPNEEGMRPSAALAAMAQHIEGSGADAHPADLAAFL